MKKVLIIVCMFFIVLCGCENSNNNSSKLPSDVGHKIKLSTENIDNYIRYSYIYERTENKEEISENNYTVTYYAYILEIKVYPKINNCKFENASITLGRFVTLTGLNGVYCNDDYTYTVYLDETGSGEFRDMIWVRGAWEKEAFTKKYFNVEGYLYHAAL